MEDVKDLALIAFDIVAKAADKLKEGLNNSERAAFDDILTLQTAAMQVASGERINTAFFNIRIERLSAYLQDTKNTPK